MASETLQFNLLARDNASRVFSKVGQSADQTRSHFSKIGGALLAVGKLAGVGAVAVGGLGVAGAVMGVKVAASMENARIGFTTMLGSAEKADRFLKKLADFAARTPFEFPELQQASSSLIAAGFHANKIIPIMTTLGDVTSGVGTGSEGIQRATVALQQMSAAGRITGEDLNQLRDAGIPVFDLLTAATGKSTAEIAKMAQAGTLGRKEMQELFRALETGNGLERFNGLMEKQAQSLNGLWSTFKDTLGMGLANAITPLIPLLKDGLGRASEFLAAALAKVPVAIGAIGDAYDAVAPRIQKLIAYVRDDLIPAWTKFAQQVGPALSASLRSIAASVDDLASTFTNGRSKSEGMGNSLVALAKIGPVVAAELRLIAVNVKVLVEAFEISTIAVRTFARVAANLIDDFLGTFLGMVTAVLRGTANVADALGMDSLAAKLRGAANRIEDFKNQTVAALRGLGKQGTETGIALGQGLADGIRASTGLAVGAAGDMANRVAAQARRVLAVSSPSQVAIEIGDFFAQGLAVGIKKGTAVALDATTALIEKVKAKLDELRSRAADIRNTAANAVRGALDVGGLGATTTTTDAEGNEVSTTARVTDQIAAFAAQSRAFSTAISAAVAKGINPSLIAQVANLGPSNGLVAAQALAAMSAAEVGQVNAQLALADKFAAKVGATVLTTTGLPADIARQQRQLDILRDIRADLNQGRDIVIHVHGGDPDAVVDAIRTYVRRNGLLRNVTA